jgi:hypothetical protein
LEIYQKDQALYVIPPTQVSFVSYTVKTLKDNPLAMVEICPFLSFYYWVDKILALKNEIKFAFDLANKEKEKKEIRKRDSWPCKKWLMKCWVLSVFDHWFPVLGQGDQIDIIIVPYKEVKIILYIYIYIYFIGLARNG